jgi:hypothetical protein
MTERNDAASAAASDTVWPNCKVFITGGSGYVGRNLIKGHSCQRAGAVAKI